MTTALVFPPGRERVVLGNRRWFAGKLRRLGTAAAGMALIFVCPCNVFAEPSDAPAGAAAQAAGPAAADWTAMLFVFVLATFIGLGVITRVSRLLHTPLMSLTNAISAIAIVGAIAVAGSDHPLPITILGAIALFASTTNIVSGFLITDRMLKMFKRQEPPAKKPV